MAPVEGEGTMAEHQGEARAPLFRRELPGGGYVVVGVERPATDRDVPRTCVWLERRAGDERNAEYRDAPLIAIADGDETSAGFTEMYRLAADNAAVARGLMEWRAKNGPPVSRAA
jgi:hypothetical protein